MSFAKLPHFLFFSAIYHPPILNEISINTRTLQPQVNLETSTLVAPSLIYASLSQSSQRPHSTLTHDMPLSRPKSATENDNESKEPSNTNTTLKKPLLICPEKVNWFDTVFCKDCGGAVDKEMKRGWSLCLGVSCHFVRLFRGLRSEENSS
jgi:hypothetical protein